MPKHGKSGGSKPHGRPAKMLKEREPPVPKGVIHPKASPHQLKH